MGLSDVVPFLLSDLLSKLGAIHIAAPTVTSNVVIDGQLITGQMHQLRGRSGHHRQIGVTGNLSRPMPARP